MAAPISHYKALQEQNENYTNAIDAHIDCDSMLLGTSLQQSPHALHQHIVHVILPWARHEEMCELVSVARKVQTLLHCFTLSPKSSPWRQCPIKRLFSDAMTNEIRKLQESLKQSMRENYARHHAHTLQSASWTSPDNQCCLCFNETVSYQCGLDLITRGLTTNMPNIYISSDCCVHSYCCFSCWQRRAESHDMTFAGAWPKDCPYCRQKVHNLKVFGDPAWCDQWTPRERWKAIEERISHASLLISAAQGTRDTQKRTLEAKFSCSVDDVSTRYSTKNLEISHTL